jgi:predicted DNA-binding ribbon-helix-helix protein
VPDRGHSSGRSGADVRRKRFTARKFIVAGHPTSLRLEPEWLQWIREIAAECGMSMKAFMTAVAIAKSPSASLTAALRLYIADYFYRRAPHNAFFDPNSRFHFRVGRSRKLPRARPRSAVSNAIG